MGEVGGGPAEVWAESAQPEQTRHERTGEEEGGSTRGAGLGEGRPEGKQTGAGLGPRSASAPVFEPRPASSPRAHPRRKPLPPQAPARQTRAASPPGHRLAPSRPYTAANAAGTLPGSSSTCDSPVPAPDVAPAQAPPPKARAGCFPSAPDAPGPAQSLRGAGRVQAGGSAWWTGQGPAMAEAPRCHTPGGVTPAARGPFVNTCLAPAQVAPSLFFLLPLWGRVGGHQQLTIPGCLAWKVTSSFSCFLSTISPLHYSDWFRFQK